MAKLVWSFNMSPGIEPATGKQLELSDIDTSIETAWTNGFLTTPMKFPLQLTPRSAKHREVIRREYEIAQEVFKLYEGEQQH